MNQKEISKPDYNKLYKNDLFIYLERIEDLEKNYLDILRKNDFSVLSWSTSSLEVKKRLEKIKKEISFLNEKIEKFKSDFMNIIYELRMSANRDEFETLNKKIENFNYENFISKQEFIRLLKDNL